MGICAILSQRRALLAHFDEPGRRRLTLICKCQSEPQDIKVASPKLFVFGLGYTGKGLAKLSLGKGW